MCARVTVSKLTGEGNRDLTVDISAVDLSSKTRPIGGGPVPARPLGGRVLSVVSSADGSTTLTIGAWNTGESQSISRTRANPSHAERQFVDFMERKQRTDGDFFANITMVDVHLDCSPCAPCSDALVGLLRDIRAAQPAPAAGYVVRRAGTIVSRKEKGVSGLTAVLRWESLYENRIQGTTWHNLLDLTRTGWLLRSPRDARPMDRTAQTDLVRIEDG
jgi:hypothetical protein